MITSIYLFAAGFTVFLLIFALASFSFLPSYGATMQRVQEVTKAQTRAFRRLRELSWSQLLSQTAAWLRRYVRRFDSEALSARLAQAGYRGALPLDLYTTLRILGPPFALLVALCIPYLRLFWIFALPALTYLSPDLLLSMLVSRRAVAVRKGLPDTIDLLVICVDAGLGLDQAMLRVAGELSLSHPEIHEELMQINREQRAGKPRLAAWQAMLERVRIAETEALVSMLIQTERFGTPIARALRAYAAGARQQRTRNAEEKAAKTTVKIIFPLVLFIFPSLFIVLLGPAAITILHGFGTGF